MKVFDASQTRSVLSYRSIAHEIDRILVLKKRGVAFAPERIVMEWNQSDCLLVMPAHDDAWLINKLVTLHRSNPQIGLPTIQGEEILIRLSDGKRVLQLDGATVTAMRTAALSMVAIQRMGYQDANTFSVCGSGIQAASHIEALFEWKPTCHIQLYARNKHAAQAIVSTMKNRGCQIDLENDLGYAIANSQIVITATSSPTPLIDGLMVPKERLAKILFVAVGAYRSDMAELSPELVSRVEGPVVVDTVEGALREAGDLLGANIPPSRIIGLETMDHSQLRGMLHIFKSVGNALWDLAAARVAVARIENEE